jgi:hypothetical protein
MLLQQIWQIGDVDINFVRFFFFLLFVPLKFFLFFLIYINLLDEILSLLISWKKNKMYLTILYLTKVQRFYFNNIFHAMKQWIQIHFCLFKPQVCGYDNTISSRIISHKWIQSLLIYYLWSSRVHHSLENSIWQNIDC